MVRAWIRVGCVMIARVVPDFPGRRTLLNARLEGSSISVSKL